MFLSLCNLRLFPSIPWSWIFIRLSIYSIVLLFQIMIWRLHCNNTLCQKLKIFSSIENSAMPINLTCFYKNCAGIFRFNTLFARTERAAFCFQCVRYIVYTESRKASERVYMYCSGRTALCLTNTDTSRLLCVDLRCFRSRTMFSKLIVCVVQARKGYVNSFPPNFEITFLFLFFSFCINIKRWR